MDGCCRRSRNKSDTADRVKVSTFRIGSPVRRGKELRIGATRLPPRGVPKARWKRDGYFDVWFPNVAPTRELLAWIRQRDINDEQVRINFFRRYERELLRTPDARHAINLLAEISTRTPISVGCFCRDESRCHRSVLRRVIEQAAGG